MTDTVIPFPTSQPRSEFGLRPPKADKAVIDAALMLAREESARMETQATKQATGLSFEQDLRQRRVPKSEDLDSAARLDAIAGLIAQEADIVRRHYRSDAFLLLREMQSMLETEAARIRADWE